MCIALFPSLNFRYSCIIQFELVQLKIPNYKQITLADVRSPFRTTVGESVTKFWPRKCFTAVILIPAVFLRFFFCLFVFLYRCFKNILNDLIYARCYHPAETKLRRRKKKLIVYFMLLSTRRTSVFHFSSFIVALNMCQTIFLKAPKLRKSVFSTVW